MCQKKGCKIMQIDIETLQAFKDEKTIDFISDLEDLFEEYLDSENTDSVLTAMQAWLYSLPRYAAVSDKVYTGNGNYGNLTASTTLFRNSLKNPEIEFHAYILKKLPEIFLTDDYDKIFKCIIEAKKELENVINEIKSALILDIYKHWETSDNDLFLVVGNWYDSLPEKTKKHLFDNGEDNLFKIINEHEDDSFLEELSLLICGIKIEDFKENSPEIFISKLKDMKQTIEKYPHHAKHSDKLYEILYAEETGKALYAAFEGADYDDNAKVMYSEFEHYLCEYGNSLTANQKRPVLLDLLVNVRR